MTKPGDILDWLAVGDLRTDGLAREVAAVVLKEPAMLDDLLHGLASGRGVVRGHAADAIERVSRERPELLVCLVERFSTQARHDPIPMVRWHLAMLLANLAGDIEQEGLITRTLLALLADRSPFVRSWAISGLCQIGRHQPSKREAILTQLSPLQRDPSIAVRHRAEKAVRLLLDDRLPMPASWVKRRRPSRPAG